MKSILVAEDQKELREGLGRRLTRRGFIIYEAASVDEAIKIITTHNLDLILSDINFEETKSGFDIFYFIKNQNLNIPFIFLTGHGEGTAEMKQALEAGAHKVLAKPVDFPDLLQVICDTLNIDPQSLPLTIQHKNE